MRFASIRHLALTLLLGAAAFSVAGRPAQADPLGVVAGETLDLKANQLDVDVDGGTAVLIGEVTAKLGDVGFSRQAVQCC